MYPFQSDDEPIGEPYYGDSSVYASPPSPRRRRTIVAAASLAVILVGAVVVDRIAAAGAASRTAEAFQKGMGTSRRPDVHVGGFPVLTQLAAGSLRHVEITAHDIPARGTARPLPVTRLVVGVNGLKTSGSAEEAHARSVEATAFLSYDDLSSTLGLGISQGGRAGLVDATVSLPLGGDVTVSAAISAAGGNRIAFSGIRVTQGVDPSRRRAARQGPVEAHPAREHPRGTSPAIGDAHGRRDRCPLHRHVRHLPPERVVRRVKCRPVRRVRGCRESAQRPGGQAVLFGRRRVQWRCDGCISCD